MSEYVARDVEPLVLRAIGQFPSVAITGPRQSGKTTLLRHLLPDYSYLTLDDPLTRTQAIDDPELLLDSAGERVVIDEIQYAVPLLSYLKMRIDRRRDMAGQFILTGSQQFALMKNLSESLAGRVGLFELLSFSLTEMARGTHREVGEMKPRESFVHACLRGSFPEPALTGSPDTRAWYSAYVQTYLERDIRSIYDVGSLRDFERFLQLLATRCSQMLNLSALAADVGVAVNTVRRWISILEACRIIYLLPPYYANTGKRITKAPKLYFLDCGLVCYLTRLRDEEHLLQGSMGGPLFENYCLQEAVKASLAAGIQPRFYYLRTRGGLEIDLLAERPGGSLLPFEFKLAQTPKTEMASGLTRLPAEFPELSFGQGSLVSLSERKGALARGVDLMPIGEFVEAIKAAAIS